MRKHLAPLSAMTAALILSACSQYDVLLTDTPSKASLTAQVESVESRVSLGASLACEWESEDEIALYDGTAIREFVASSVSGSSAVFTGEMSSAETYYAAYPYSAATSFSSGNWTVSIPSSQIVAAGDSCATGALVSVATFTDPSSVSFRQVTGLVKITITQDGITDIILTGNNSENIAGTVTVNSETGAVNAFTDASASITLSHASGTFPQGNYYVAVAPVSFDYGISLSFTSSSSYNAMKVGGNSATVSRAAGINLGDVTSSLVWDDGTTPSSTSSVTYTYTTTSGVTKTYYAKYLVNGGELALVGRDITASGTNVIGVLVVNGGSAILSNCAITKSGSGSGASNEDDYNFYGINNAVVVLGSSSSATLNGCTVTTSGEYANAVFASDGGTITIHNGITITTTANSARGLFASYSGTVTAPEGGVSITTSGSHCAALATDRGSGTISVGSSSSAKASTISTVKNDSPCIYSTGTITAYNLTGTCTKGQAVVVEGKNIVNLTGCTLSGGRESQGCIFLYQSSSGDAADSDASSSKSTLNASDCTFHALNSADMFVVTHTTAQVNASGCTYYSDSSTGAFATSGASQYLINCYTVNSSQWGTGNYLNAFTTTDTLTGTVNAGDSSSSAVITCGSGSNLTSSGTGTITIN